jgi:hypothetical protein
MRLETQAQGLDPDGSARWLVRVRFVDEAGQPTRLIGGGDVEFAATGGDAQWQTRTRYGGPAAVIRTTRAGTLAVRATVKNPTGIPDAVARIDAHASSGPSIAAGALGPHLVQIGWFPASRGPSTVVRSGLDGTHVVCAPAPPASTCGDRGVTPGATYRYSVVRAAGRTTSPPLTVPSKLAAQSLDAMRGKGMWLSFSPDGADADAFDKLDPRAQVARAKAAGIRYIELRMAYGEFWEVTPAAKAYVDTLIDAAAAEGIATLAWTVPRAPTFADLALATAAARYRTASGTPVAGLALDLERGDGYFGDGPAAAAAMAAYVRVVREALGPSALLVATVEDPYLNGLTNRDVPIAAIAAEASALQPMVYWRMLQRAISESGARAVIRRSLETVRREAGRTIAVNVGGQTSGIGPCGAPSAAEIEATLDESRRDGALGETFFDWTGTLDPQWSALGAFPW